MHHRPKVRFWSNTIRWCIMSLQACRTSGCTAVGGSSADDSSGDESRRFHPWWECRPNDSDEGPPRTKKSTGSMWRHYCTYSATSQCGWGWSYPNHSSLNTHQYIHPCSQIETDKDDCCCKATTIDQQIIDGKSLFCVTEEGNISICRGNKEVCWWDLCWKAIKLKSTISLDMNATIK